MGDKHRFGGSDTCWVFLAATHEARHLDDIIFCADVLRQRGVSSASVLVFTDHPAARAHFAPYEMAEVHPLLDLSSVLSKQVYKYVVVVCGGHGGELGLQSQPPISPHDLFSAISLVNGAEVATVFLCQCYAGVFNYIDATRGNPHYVVIGSTNFYPSLSAGIRLSKAIPTRNGLQGLVEWQANIYQVSLFQWLLHPTDIDGDGHVTLVDAYKSAGVSTISRLQSIWVNLFGELRDLEEGLRAAEQRGDDAVVIDAYKQSITANLSLLYNIQEPWLLHARMASDVGFVSVTRLLGD